MRIAFRIRRQTRAAELGCWDRASSFFAGDSAMDSVRDDGFLYRFNVALAFRTVLVAVDSSAFAVKSSSMKFLQLAIVWKDHVGLFFEAPELTKLAFERDFLFRPVNNCFCQRD